MMLERVECPHKRLGSGVTVDAKRLLLRCPQHGFKRDSDAEIHINRAQSVNYFYSRAQTRAQTFAGGLLCMQDTWQRFRMKKVCGKWVNYCRFSAYSRDHNFQARDLSVLSKIG